MEILFDNGTHSVSQKLGPQNLRTQYYELTFKGYRDHILRRSKLNSPDQELYSSRSVKQLLVETLQLNYAPTYWSRIRLIAAKFCYLNDLPSRLVEYLQDYAETVELTFPTKIGNWHNTFVWRLSEDKSELQPRLSGVRNLTKDDACTIIAATLWFHHYTSMPGKSQINVNVDVAAKEIFTYWAKSIRSKRKVKIGQTVLFQGTPWLENASFRCDFHEFVLILKAKFNGRAPSESWLRKALCTSNMAQLRSRDFTHRDFIRVLGAIEASPRLSKKLFMTATYSEELGYLHSARI